MESLIAFTPLHWVLAERADESLVQPLRQALGVEDVPAVATRLRYDVCWLELLHANDARLSPSVRLSKQLLLQRSYHLAHLWVGSQALSPSWNSSGTGPPLLVAVYAHLASHVVQLLAVEAPKDGDEWERGESAA